ncbi:MAG: NAD-dependent succinate-semialdehyde dehydrogenase [Mycetocola sp.]
MVLTSPSSTSDSTISRRLSSAVPIDLYIGGTWLPSASGRRFPVLDPSTGQVIAEVADAGVQDAEDALNAAVDAAAGWAATPARRRGELLRRAFDLLQQERDVFARTMTLEMGKPLAEAHGEITYGGEFLRWFSEEAVRIAGRFGANPEGTGTTIISHTPVGPCFLITPWNFPLAMATRKIAPALAAGCTVVIKPAALTPLTTLLFVELLERAGLPAGVVNVITSTASAAVSERIIQDPRLRKLSFTGSTEVGRALIAQSAQNVLRTSMELGGNAPFLVFEDADVDAAVEGAMLAKFRNIGQACTAANRFLVHADVVAEFTGKVTERVAALRVGSGLDHDVSIGPLIDDRAVAKVAELVADATARGARVQVGGHAIDRPGSFFEPTVISEVSPSSRLMTEEIFGPVLAITSFDNEDHAVRLANNTEYGLVSYAYTRDLDRAHRLIGALETGMMGINTGLVSNASAPFGGVKQSGIGKEGGAEGIEEYLASKYTLLKTAVTT